MHIFVHMIQRGGQKELQTVSSFLKVWCDVYVMLELLHEVGLKI